MKHSMNGQGPQDPGRRAFVSTLVGGAGSLSLASAGVWALPAQAQPGKDWTVQQVIDLIIGSVPGAPFKQTVDTLKAGSSDQKVSGIVTTMFATCEVITQSAKLGANFIIAHEPTFYNHLDETEWLVNSDVYHFKRDLLNKHGMAVWRCHDYVHAHRPDGVMEGVLTKLGWNQFHDPANPWLVNLPSKSLGDLISEAKNKLGIERVRIIGDLSQKIQRVALIPGAVGGRMQINVLQNSKPDLIMVGEISEWETAEYVRDARFMGSNTSLLILGHVLSEEPGSEWMARWLAPQVPGINITHVPANNALSFA